MKWTLLGLMLGGTLASPLARARRRLALMRARSALISARRLSLLYARRLPFDSCC